MRSFIIALLLGATVWAQATAPPPQNPPAALDEGQAKARALLDQMIAALGGQGYLNYHDSEQEGRGYGFTEAQAYGGGVGQGGHGIGVTFHQMWKWPDKERFELTATYFGYNPIPFSKQTSKATVVEIFNGDQGYEVTPNSTAFQEREDQTLYRRRRDHSLERVLRDWLKRPDVALFYDGPALAEQKSTERVTIAVGQDEVTIFIDVFTHLPVKKSYSFRNPTYHDKDTEAEIWGNYRTIQGIATPFNYSRTLNGKTVEERFLNRASYNLGLPDAMFSPQHPPPGNMKK